MNNKISIKGKTKIISTEDKTTVIKPKNTELTSLFDYLDLRNYDAHPKIINEDKDTIEYEYIKPINDKNISVDELANAVSSLHLKTTYYKDVSTKKYKDIYNKLIDNVDYLKSEYNNHIFNIDNERYMSPSSYLFARNFSLLNSNLTFVERELNKYYNLVKDKTKERVCVVHNNLKRNNFLKGEKLILTGWDNQLVDTPVLDLYKFYKAEYKTIDFIEFFSKYKDNFSLTKEESSLLKVLISMPSKFDEELPETGKIIETRNLIDYVNTSNKIIKSGVLDELVGQSAN